MNIEEIEGGKPKIRVKKPAKKPVKKPAKKPVKIR